MSYCLFFDCLFILICLHKILRRIFLEFFPFLGNLTCYDIFKYKKKDPRADVTKHVGQPLKSTCFARLWASKFELLYSCVNSHAIKEEDLAISSWIFFSRHHTTLITGPRCASNFIWTLFSAQMCHRWAGYGIHVCMIALSLNEKKRLHYVLKTDDLFKLLQINECWRNHNPCTIKKEVFDYYSKFLEIGKKTTCNTWEKIIWKGVTRILSLKKQNSNFIHL